MDPQLRFKGNVVSTEKLYVEKELSWLSFNERVLQEAADKSVPLIERIRFLGIFSNNLDEFYKVRFADVKRRILINQERGGQDNSKHLLTKMQTKALKLNERFDELYSELIRDMARRRIFLVNEAQLTELQQIWIKQYFLCFQKGLQLTIFYKPSIYFLQPSLLISHQQNNFSLS